MSRALAISMLEDNLNVLSLVGVAPRRRQELEVRLSVLIIPM